ncbi:MAG TPA: amidohydrolase family protein [Pseudonocardia sp.]
MTIADVLRDTPIIDVDSHVTEPPDLWTSRMSARWGDLVPHTVWDAQLGEDRWFVGDIKLPGVGVPSAAGWRDFPPDHPPTIADCDPGSYDSKARLRRLDEYGVHAQLIYPNILGFFAGAFLATKEPAFMLESVQAYNDFLTEFCAADPNRLVPLMVLPFWDIEESVREMRRCQANGHKGIVFSPDFERIGFPALPDPHWNPVLDAAQANDLSINFHIGFASMASGDFEAIMPEKETFDRARYAGEVSLYCLGNARAITTVIVSGLCERFPRLKFVSVESGFGYIPFLMESLDWQWHNNGAAKDHPGRALPSEVFRRQIYGTFWFERHTLAAIEPWADNIMFETDYPHPTSLSPGPASSADLPATMVARNFAGLSDDVARKLLHDTAAHVYNL